MLRHDVGGGTHHETVLLFGVALHGLHLASMSMNLFGVCRGAYSYYAHISDIFCKRWYHHNNYLRIK